MHLPQGTVGIELAAHDGGHEGLELSLAAGRGEAGPEQVVVELELGVVDPDRMMQTEWHTQGSLAHRARSDEAVAR